MFSTPRPIVQSGHDTPKDISFPSECLGFCFKGHPNKSVLLLSLRPSGQIILKGMAYVKCLLGSANILGYSLRQGEKLPLFALFPGGSLMIQGPDAVIMTSNPGREAGEEHWIPFFPKQAEQKKHLEPDQVSSDSCIVDETFRTKWMTTTRGKCIEAAKNQWRQLNLVVGERAVVLEVSQFPISLLDGVLRVCSGVDQPSTSDLMAVALHAPSPPQPRALLAVTGLTKKEQFREPVYLPFSWKQVVSSVCVDQSQMSQSSNQSGVRVMVIGGQGVGVSTFTRFLVNSLLSSNPLNSHPAASVSKLPRQHLSNNPCAKKASACVLDLDPRHSEQSLPGTVSCARYTAPILGPAYVYGVAHTLRRRTSIFPEWRGTRYSNLNKLNFVENPLELPEIIKEFLIGREDLSEITEEYLAATAVLVDAHRLQCEMEPLVINCTNADNSIDFRIILEVMRIVNPTHVVHIEGKINQGPETSPFNCDRANEELGRRGRCHYDVTGTYTSDTDPDRILPITEKLSYVYGRIPSVVKSMDAYKTSDSRRHDVAIASFFSALWPHFSPTIESTTLQRSVISTCQNYALHVRHGGVHYNQLLNSINCSGLVSLCYIDPKHIRKFGGENYSVVDIQPRGSCACLDTTSDRASSVSKDRKLKRFKLSATLMILPPFNGDRLFRVHGWAVVKGVDPVDKNIHLLVPGCASVLTKVNCIVQSNMQLPEAFGWLLYRGYQSRPYETFVEQGPRNSKVKQRTNRKH